MAQAKNLDDLVSSPFHSQSTSKSYHLSSKYVESWLLFTTSISTPLGQATFLSHVDHHHHLLTRYLVSAATSSQFGSFFPAQQPWWAYWNVRFCDHTVQNFLVVSQMKVKALTYKASGDLPASPAITSLASFSLTCSLCLLYLPCTG